MVSFPNYKPAYSAQRNDLSPATSLGFGDGYEQRFSFGFAMVPQEWDLTFIGIDSEMDEIDVFLSARAIDQQLFDWTTPDGDSTYTWICKSWKKERFDLNVSRVTARFEQRTVIAPFQGPTGLHFAFNYRVLNGLGVTSGRDAKTFPIIVGLGQTVWSITYTQLDGSTAVLSQDGSQAYSPNDVLVYVVQQYLLP